jgi:predicted Rossmann fold nucleotide-binding protein DprA/Smf involved in DNA uptake
VPERIAVVGSRKGVRLDIVQTFMVTLAMQQPDSVVISGGADGVDSTAEEEWVRHGGTVVSYRPRAMHKPNEIESWAITKLTMGPNPSVEILSLPTFADIASALFYRNTLIVDDADRVVAFHAHHSPGTAHTKAYAKDRGVPVYDMVK